MQKGYEELFFFERNFETVISFFHEYKIKTVFEIFLDQLLKGTIDQF